MVTALLLAACAPSPVNLYFVVVDGGSVRVPVSVAEFAGYHLDGDAPIDVAPEVIEPRWLPVGATVPGGERSGVDVRFAGDALRLRGQTTEGTPFTLRVAMDTLSYGKADLGEPEMVLVLDAGRLIDGAVIDAASEAADPTPEDGQPYPMAFGPDSELAASFVSGAPLALWLGTPADAPQRFSGHWPYVPGQFGEKTESSSGCGSGQPVASGPSAPDTGVPDTGAVPSDTSWTSPDSGAATSSGCSGGDTGADSGSGSGGCASSDTGSGDSGSASTCGCGGSDTGSTASVPVSRPGMALVLGFLGPLLALRRRRQA